MRTLRSWLAVGIGVGAAAVLVVVLPDGSPGGRATKVALAVAVGTVVVWSLRAREGRGPVVAAAVAGLVCLAIGAGVGPRHLVGGEVVAGSAGVVALLAGLVVLVLAGIALLRGTRWWQRLGALPVAFVALALLIPSVIAVAASDTPPTPLGGRTPADVGHPAATMTFPARDGTALEGWWVPSRNGAAVVVLHGSGSNREDVLDHLGVLADAGYGVLAFDARGHGGSEGAGMDLGWHAESDLGGALDLVASLPGVDPERIGAVGLSMGGEEALSVIGDPLLGAVVAEGATRRAAADDGWLPTHPGGLLQRAMDWWQDRVVETLTWTDAPASLRSGIDGDTPVLLVVAGTVDDESRAARWLRDAAPDAVEVWSVPGAGHSAALAQDPEGWAATVVSFLDRSLRGASA